jgi:trehalose-6-phosphate synthase
MSDCIQISDEDQREIIIASNRGPASFHTSADGELVMQRGSGGLVTALMSLAHRVDTTWISCALTEEDRVWQEGEISLSENASPFHLSLPMSLPSKATTMSSPIPYCGSFSIRCGTYPTRL